MNIIRPYWLSFFVAPLVWGTASILVRGHMTGPPQRRAFRFIQSLGALYGTLALILSPLVLSIPWPFPLGFALAAIFVSELAPRIIYGQKALHLPSGERREKTPASFVSFHQMRNSISWFLATGLMVLFAALTRDCAWWAGAGVYGAASVWNIYSEYSVKPAVQEFYSDVDDVSLWSGPLLHEEAPVLLMPLAALMLFPLGPGEVSSSVLARAFHATLPLLSSILAVSLLGAFLVSLYMPEDLRRLPAVRALFGLSLLLALALTGGLIAGALPTRMLILGGGSILDSRYFGSGFDATGTCLSTLVWFFVLALLLGTIPTFWVLVRIFAHRPEYDLFISFSSANRAEAAQVASRSRKVGLRHFFSDEALYAGDRFREQLRKAVRNSSEMAVLYTPESRVSSWVRQESAAGWAMGKRVSPILYRCTAGDLEDPLRDAQCVEFERVDDYLLQVRRRVRRRGGIFGRTV